MDSYEDIIHRLEGQLRAIAESLSRPVASKANLYRVAAECICKAIIDDKYAHSAKPALERLSAEAAAILASTEPSRDVEIFRVELKYLQGIGNVFSHDGSASADTNSDAHDRLFDALAKVIRVAFYGSAERERPMLPREMKTHFSARQLSRGGEATLSLHELAQLCYPKNPISNGPRSDQSAGPSHDYVVVDLGGGLTKGLLFIRQRSPIERTLREMAAMTPLKRPSSLEIVTPKVYTSDGKEVNRRKSIEDKAREILPEQQGWNCHVKYYDDFAWQYCLPAQFKESAIEPKPTLHFVQQQLQLSPTSSAAINAIDYLDEALRNPQTHAAVHVIVGQAGIGKTTLCDSIVRHVHERFRRKVLLFSATDFRDVQLSEPISSVQDLYNAALEHGLIDEDLKIEGKNFEINLACGNLALVIDGFDELESCLGGHLNSADFISSLGTLDDYLQNVFVILTVRDHNVERFESAEHVAVGVLRGFSDDDVNTYLQKRLPNEQLPEAKRMLSPFGAVGADSRDTTVPLYASLICDHLSDGVVQGHTEQRNHGDSGGFFWTRSAVDVLVAKIIKRELAKQSLGSVTPGDYFEILIELIRAPDATLTLAALQDAISACARDGAHVPIANFSRSPFLHCTKEVVRFKYDSLLDYFKSRYICRKLLDGVFVPSPTVDFLAEAYNGSGPLLEELTRIIAPDKLTSDDAIVGWLRHFRDHATRPENAREALWTRAMSSLLYWSTHAAQDKFERVVLLKRFFEGDVWLGFSVYGRFGSGIV